MSATTDSTDGVDRRCRDGDAAHESAERANSSEITAEAGLSAGDTEQLPDRLRSDARRDPQLKNDAGVTEAPKQDGTSTQVGLRDGPAKKRTSQLGSLAQRTKRKKRSSLAERSAAATAQPPKLNTLEKSKKDWDDYKGGREGRSTTSMTEAEREELDSQTQGGGSGLSSVKGYIHRKDFLDRVHERLENQEQEGRYTR